MASRLAYDLSIYEPREAGVKAQQQPRPDLRVLPRPRRRVSILSRLITTVIIVMVLGSIALVLYQNVQLNELSGEITMANLRYQAYESEYQRMSSLVEGKISLRNVEAIAKERLGLAKMDSYQVEYVDRCDGDKIVLTEEKGVGIKGLFSQLRLAWETLKIRLDIQ